MEQNNRPLIANGTAAVLHNREQKEPASTEILLTHSEAEHIEERLQFEGFGATVVACPDLIFIYLRVLLSRRLVLSSPLHGCFAIARGLQTANLYSPCSRFLSCTFLIPAKA